MSKLLSVVVTSYNHAEFLPQRLESLLAQTYRPFEIIVVDDCSTDGSLAVLRRYEEDPRVKVVSMERNSGTAAASNHGASLASGEYLMFAECDDFDEPTHAERLVKALESSSAGAAFCRSRLVDERGVVLGDDFENREPAFHALCAADVLIPGALMRRFLLRACVVPNMSAATIRKASFDAVGGLAVSAGYRLCLDWDLWNRLARREDFFYVSEPLNSFRSHAGTARSTLDVARQVREIYAVLTDAAAAMNLSPADRFRFKLGLARIWAGYFSQSPAAWIRGFSAAWAATLPYDAFSLGHLALAAAAKAVGLRFSLAESAAR